MRSMNLRCERKARWPLRFPHAVIVALLLGASPAHAFDECGELANAYGPFDYRTSRDKLAIVESAALHAGRRGAAPRQHGPGSGATSITPCAHPPIILAR